MKTYRITFKPETFEIYSVIEDDGSPFTVTSTGILTETLEAETPEAAALEATRRTLLREIELIRRHYTWRIEDEKKLRVRLQSKFDLLQTKCEETLGKRIKRYVQNWINTTRT